MPSTHRYMRRRLLSLRNRHPQHLLSDQPTQSPLQSSPLQATSSLHSTTHTTTKRTDPLILYQRPDHLPSPLYLVPYLPEWITPLVPPVVPITSPPCSTWRPATAGLPSPPPPPSSKTGASPKIPPPIAATTAGSRDILTRSVRPPTSNVTKRLGASSPSYTLHSSQRASMGGARRETTRLTGRGVA
jgi:hypothetical protein